MNANQQQCPCGDNDGNWCSLEGCPYPKVHPSSPSPKTRLAAKHTGMKVDYRGLINQARQGLRREPGIAEMLRQLEEHLTELGQRWYAGDAAVVDELLQLYCIERDARASLATTSEGQP